MTAALSRVTAELLAGCIVGSPQSLDFLVIGGKNGAAGERVAKACLMASSTTNSTSISVREGVMRNAQGVEDRAHGLPYPYLDQLAVAQRRRARYHHHHRVS